MTKITQDLRLQTAPGAVWTFWRREKSYLCQEVNSGLLHGVNRL